MKCFNGHECGDAVICPECGATVSEEYSKPEYELMTIEQRNVILLKWLENIKIETQDQRKDCSNMLTNARQAKREAESLLKKAVEPSKLEIERVKGIFNPFIEKLDKGIDSLTRAMSEWDTEQERLRAEALKQMIEDQVDVDTGEVTTILAQPVPEVSHTTKSDIGMDIRKDSFDIVITNPDLVPRQYCEPSLVKLRAGFKLVSEIPGAVKVPKKVYTTRVK